MFRFRPSIRIASLGTSISCAGANGQPRGWQVSPFFYRAALYRGRTYAFNANPSTAPYRSAPVPGNYPQSPILRPVLLNLPTLAQVGGAKMSDLLAIWDTVITPLGPVDGYMLEGNINDTFHATNNTVYRAQVREMLTERCQPQAQIIWMGAVAGYVDPPVIGFPPGEKWSLFGDAFHAQITAKNLIVREEVEDLGPRGTYIDMQSVFEAAEPALNPGDLGSGVLTTDGVHFKEEGLQFIERNSRPYFAVDGV